MSGQRMGGWDEIPRDFVFRVLPITVVSMWVILIFVLFVFFRDVEPSWLFWSMVAMVTALDMGGYVFLRFVLTRRIGDRWRTFPVTPDFAMRRIEGEMTRAGMDFFKFSRKEYKESGSNKDWRWLETDDKKVVALYEFHGGEELMSITDQTYKRNDSVSVRVKPHIDDHQEFLEGLMRTVETALKER